MSFAMASTASSRSKPSFWINDDDDACPPDVIGGDDGPLRRENSVWGVLQRESRAKAEAEFIRSEVGDDLFARNDLLFDEIDNLVAILEDMQADDPSHQQRVGPSAAVGKPRSLLGGSSIHLARQLAMRNRLQHILATDDGPRVFASKRDRMVAEYVAHGNQRPPSAAGGSGGRPMSRSSRTSSTAESRPLSAGLEGTSSKASFSESVEAVAASGRVRHTNVSEVKGEIRELLQQEHALLLECVDALRDRIEGAITWSRFQEPTAAELSQLQKAVSEHEAAEEHRMKVQLLPTGGRPNSQLPPMMIPSPPRRPPADM